MSGVPAVHDREVLSKVTKNAISEQLNRLIASPYFSQSKRFPIFLRFVVEHALAGDVERIRSEHSVSRFSNATPTTTRPPIRSSG